MEVKVLFFAQIQELFGVSEIILSDIQTTEEAIDALLKHQPKLSNYTYILAVNEKIVKSNQSLQNNDVLAILPPFAGG